MIQYNYIGMPIDYFALKSGTYQHYPPCQRDYVWKNNMQQKFIDSILRGLPIPPITLLPTDDAIIGETYWVVDGQQRLKTIERYVKNEFPTASSFRDEPLVKPIAKGKTYQELDEHDRSMFDNYHIQVCIVQGVSERDMELVFRRLNYQVKLNLAERLYSYTSPAKVLGEKLSEHSFWIDTYKGRKDRKQIYQILLMTMFMETFDIYCNMTTARLIDIACGAIGREFPGDLNKRITRRLDLAERLFMGADIRNMTHIIPLYQSLMLLEADNYDLENAPTGCLTHWFNAVRKDALELQRNKLKDLFAVLTKVYEQHRFWLEQLPRLETAPGLIRKDSKRTFSSLDKLKAWINQNGKCIICGKNVTTSDEGHHVEAHSLGGKTTSENCVLIHKRCHKTLTLPGIKGNARS